MFDALEAARAIIPELEATSARSEGLRHLDPAAAAVLKRAGLISLMAPARHGGYELPLRAQILSCAVTAQGCSAASWVQMVCGAHTYIAGRYPALCQEEVFDTGPDVLIPGTLASQGTVTCTDGGWRLNGRWQFASGADHGPWLMIGARHPAGRPGGVHVIVPAREIEIDDTWFTLGMRGTGSKDLVAHDVFVPAHRAMPTTDLFMGTFAGEVGALYHLPVLPALSSMLAGSVLGMAERGLARFIEQAGGRQDVLIGGAKAAKAAVQLRVAEAAGEIATARLLLEQSCDRFDAVMALDRPPMALEDRAQIRWNAAYAVELCRRAIERLFAASGAHAVYDPSGLQRVFRDVNTACHHAIVDFDTAAEVKGRLALGLDPGVPIV